MYSKDEYNALVSKYGLLSSWAIWNEENPENTLVIEENIDQLNCNYIFVGLNISRLIDLSAWRNFHDNTHARKLRYACNNTGLRGSYLTDLFKDLPEANSNKVKDILTTELINKNVDFFIQEMTDVQIGANSIFIILGSLTAQYFDRYYKQHFNNKVIYYDHYSAYAKYTDKEWVDGLWDKLELTSSIIKP
jgi:hypothetical protein